MEEMNKKASGKALIPFIVFIVSYLGIGTTLIIKGDPMGFYGFRSPIAVILGIIVAFIILDGSIDDKFNTFVKGCGNENIIIMCIIYLLAGSFSAVTKEIGGVDSTVNLGLSIIPPNLITVGIFLIACFLSIATGSSVGTIVAIGPIAIGCADKSNISLALMIATLIGGAMFGDNLSIISDTTIAATRTQGVEMKDKFKTNVVMAIPAMIFTIILLLIFGRPDTTPVLDNLDYNIVKVLPYLFVLITAIAGMNVFIVLTIGTLISGGIGLYYNVFNLLEYSNVIYSGFLDMFDIFLLSLLTGGLAALVQNAGGLEWLLIKIKSFVRGRKSAELAIAFITVLTDAATANNTIAIIIAGPIAKDISKEYKVDPRRTASLLDSFGSVMQGFIPYGAQLLMAVQFTNGSVSPFEVIPYLWYQFALAVVVIISIFVPFVDGYIKKHPWDFEKWKPAEKVKSVK